ncbi:hypothetical protein AALP_AA4G114100 [Arabis alpina]|uniref:DUF4283 domain-containing protein n=1 Tax=Arabis alpina TaxID=50452 RepID=A0A087H2L4_ARAAL|nr:hypothetical protein AALP_AA4G114100 [Arabis alpina]
MDMGDGRVHFRFQREEDLEVVMDHRPYHFDGFMIALERWIPTVRRDFPTTIPFWITIHGLPDYRREEEAVTSIGEALGEFLTVDVTQPIPRVRVTVDSNVPLTLRSESDDDGTICVLDFQYEKLQKHCGRCLRLTHETPSCPEKARESQSQREHRREHHRRREDENSRRRLRTTWDESSQSTNPPKPPRLPMGQPSSSRRRSVRRDILPELTSTRESVVKPAQSKLTTKEWIQRSFGEGSAAGEKGSTSGVEKSPLPHPVDKRTTSQRAPWYRVTEEDAAIANAINFQIARCMENDRKSRSVEVDSKKVTEPMVRDDPAERRRVDPEKVARVRRLSGEETDFTEVENSDGLGMSRPNKVKPEWTLSPKFRMVFLGCW